MTRIQIGERIRELREIQNYTRERFAEKIDILIKFLYEIEAGKKGFSADTLCRVSQALSVSCDYIMLGKENSSQNTEKIVCVLQMFSPGQISKLQNVLKILFDMCGSL